MSFYLHGGAEISFIFLCAFNFCLLVLSLLIILVRGLNQPSPGPRGPTASMFQRFPGSPVHLVVLQKLHHANRHVRFLKEPPLDLFWHILTPESASKQTFQRSRAVFLCSLAVLVCDLLSISKRYQYSSQLGFYIWMRCSVLEFFFFFIFMCHNWLKQTFGWVFVWLSDATFSWCLCF